MKLCPKCGCLSFFNSYFQKWMCNTCEHQFIETKDKKPATMNEEAITTIKQLLSIIRKAVLEGYDITVEQDKQYMRAKTLIGEANGK